VNISISSLDRADALNQRDFRQYVGSTFLATIAMMIQSVAVAWQVYDLVRNPLALGYVGLFQFLPLAIFALPAGELADRIDRRAMLAISYGVQTVCAILFLAMTVARPPGIWPFYAVLALFGSARAFAAPASQALLPRLVPEESFPRAVALTSSTRQTAVILGPAIGGAIYILGPAVAYGACAVLLIGVTVLIASLRTQNVPVAHHLDSGPLRRVMAGIAFIRRKPVVLGAISLDLFAVLLGGATALLRSMRATSCMSARLVWACCGVHRRWVPRHWDSTWRGGRSGRTSEGPCSHAWLASASLPLSSASRAILLCHWGDSSY
jgi:MFS family permease